MTYETATDTHEITSNPLRGVEGRPGPNAHYGVFDHGAHIWSYQPQGQAPVLWMSSKSWFADGQPIRGGVPVIFPWFGPGRGGNLSPAHGFLRLSTWHMSDIKDTLDRDGRLLAGHRDREAPPLRTQPGKEHREVLGADVEGVVGPVGQPERGVGGPVQHR